MRGSRAGRVVEPVHHVRRAHGVMASVAGDVTPGHDIVVGEYVLLHVATPGVGRISISLVERNTIVIVHGRSTDVIARVIILRRREFGFNKLTRANRKIAHNH